MNPVEWKLVDRLKEASTWASIGAGLGMVGVSVPSGTWQAITMIGSGAALLAGILLKEGSN